MIKMFCDICGQECRDNIAFDVRVNFISNPVPTYSKDYGEPRITSKRMYNRVLMCHTCFYKTGLPFPQEICAESNDIVSKEEAQEAVSSVLYGSKTLFQKNAAQKS